MNNRRTLSAAAGEEQACTDIKNAPLEADAKKLQPSFDIISMEK
jgi:hypothetical protein